MDSELGHVQNRRGVFEDIIQCVILRDIVCPTYKSQGWTRRSRFSDIFVVLFHLFWWGLGLHQNMCCLIKAQCFHPAEVLSPFHLTFCTAIPVHTVGSLGGWVPLGNSQRLPSNIEKLKVMSLSLSWSPLYVSILSKYNLPALLGCGRHRYKCYIVKPNVPMLWSQTGNKHWLTV